MARVIAPIDEFKVFSLDGEDFPFDNEDEVRKEAKKKGQDHYWVGVLRQKSLGSFFTTSFLEEFLEFANGECLDPEFLSKWPEWKLDKLTEAIRVILDLAHPDPLNVIEDIIEVSLDEDDDSDYLFFYPKIISNKKKPTSKN